MDMANREHRACTRLLKIFRAGPGVSPASPWARATPHRRATKWEKKILYYTLKKKLYIYIRKKKKLLEGKKNI
jgi:hypothetical protein